MEAFFVSFYRCWCWLLTRQKTHLRGYPKIPRYGTGRVQREIRTPGGCLDLRDVPKLEADGVFRRLDGFSINIEGLMCQRGPTEFKDDVWRLGRVSHSTTKPDWILISVSIDIEAGADRICPADGRTGKQTNKSFSAFCENEGWRSESAGNSCVESFMERYSSTWGRRATSSHFFYQTLPGAVDVGSITTAIIDDWPPSWVGKKKWKTTRAISSGSLLKVSFILLLLIVRS